VTRTKENDPGVEATQGLKSHLQQKQKLAVKTEKQETIANLLRHDLFLFCHDFRNILKDIN